MIGCFRYSEMNELLSLPPTLRIPLVETLGWRVARWLLFLSVLGECAANNWSSTLNVLDCDRLIRNSSASCASATDSLCSVGRLLFLVPSMNLLTQQVIFTRVEKE